MPSSQSDNMALRTAVGKYNVPTDHTLSSYEEVTVQESITIVVGASCQSTQLDTFELQDMTLYVSDPDIALQTQTIPIVMDSTSKQEGNQDGFTNCGERGYSIISGQTYLSLDQVTRELMP